MCDGTSVLPESDSPLVILIHGTQFVYIYIYIYICIQTLAEIVAYAARLSICCREAVGSGLLFSLP